MSTFNREGWSKVAVRLGDGSGVDFDKTVAELRKYIELQKHDQESMKAAILEVLRANSLHSHMTSPILLMSACSRVAPNQFDLWGDLQDRGREVIKADLTIEKGKNGGVVNPFYTAPATTA